MPIHGWSRDCQSNSGLQHGGLTQHGTTRHHFGWYEAEHGYQKQAGPARFHLGTELGAACVNISARANPCRTRDKKACVNVAKTIQSSSTNRCLLYQKAGGNF